jgi:hypothetical protein
MSAPKSSVNPYLLTIARLAFVFSPAFYWFMADAQQPSVTVEAELVQPLDAGHAKVGDSVKARVKVAWSDPTCTLKQNAMVKGRIVALQSTSKTAKDSGVALLFESGECGGHDMKPLPLTIISVIGFAPAPPALSDSAGVGIGEGSRGGAAAARNAPAIEGGKPIVPLTITQGQVFGLNDVKLGVATGPQGSSVLGTSGHNLRLETGVILVLARSADINPAPATSPVNPH